MSGFVNVKLSPVGRAQPFLLPEIAPGAPAAAAPAAANPAGATPPLPSSALASEPASLAPGQVVIVETGQGPAIGRVTPLIAALDPRRQPAADSPRRVVRRATREDLALRARHEQREREGFRVCAMKIRERGLGMKLTRVEQLFDGSRLIFYYTAEERIDFRELVRELAAHFHMRIEMRQIGVRDEARLLAGYGPCGRPLCCTTWLSAFEPVTIKMAKQQNLSLNPSRLSGMCGRLKCCLRYEIANGKGVRHAGAAEVGCGGCEGCGRSACPGCGAGDGTSDTCGWRR